ncbi:MAG: 50S ribosomal protein L3 [Candidatus Dojkabacteria bacterium]|nr:MAG: 50S ribosomal protein L3 [Candidatus Dojkabacteria bacterium]
MLLARKKGMTRVFDNNGVSVPVTILDFSDTRIIRGLKNSGVFIGIGYIKSPNKPQKGIFGEDNVPEYAIKVGDDVVDLEEFSPGDVVSVSGISKGKGFAGVVKRWDFRGGSRTHGQSDRERHPGSIGAGTTTGRVFKGLKMAGHMGVKRVTIRGLRVFDFDKDNYILTVVGTVPGSYGSVIEIYKQ